MWDSFGNQVISRDTMFLNAFETARRGFECDYMLLPGGNYRIETRYTPGFAFDSTYANYYLTPIVAMNAWREVAKP